MKPPFIRAELRKANDELREIQEKSVLERSADRIEQCSVLVRLETIQNNYESLRMANEDRARAVTEHRTSLERRLGAFYGRPTTASK
jgi:hypothetical protein